MWKNWVGIILKNISSCKKYSSCYVGGWCCICNLWSCSAAFSHFYCSPVFLHFDYSILYIAFMHVFILRQLSASWFRDIAEKCEEKWIEGTSQSYDATSTITTGTRTPVTVEVWEADISWYNHHDDHHRTCMYLNTTLLCTYVTQKESSTSVSLLFLQSNKEHREGVIVRWNESKKKRK